MLDIESESFESVSMTLDIVVECFESVWSCLGVLKVVEEFYNFFKYKKIKYKISNLF
jgi:hypothetical protein